MELSVVILNYNVKQFLKLCLESVVAATSQLSSEIIVIDNASTDGSLAMVAENFPEVQTIANATNFGFSKANNQAVKEAKGEYVCILNPDTVLKENTLRNVLEFAKTQENLGALGIRLIDGTGTFLPESRRNVPTPQVALKKLAGFDAAYYANTLRDSEIGEVDVLVGAFMLLKRTTYMDVGGFDEDYFMYGEDIDLSYKLKKRGFKNIYFGEEYCIHFKGESTLKNEIYRTRFFGAMQLFYQKHFKTNLLTNFLVSKLLSLAKVTQKFMSSKDVALSKMTAYVYVGKRNEIAYIISQLYDQPVQQVNFEEFTQLNVRHTQVILDLKYMSFSQALNVLLQNNNKGNTYRFIPQDSSVLIGSDSSTSRGAIMALK